MSGGVTGGFLHPLVRKNITTDSNAMTDFRLRFIMVDLRRFYEAVNRYKQHFLW